MSNKDKTRKDQKTHDKGRTMCVNYLIYLKNWGSSYVTVIPVKILKLKEGAFHQLFVAWPVNNDV